MDPFVLGRLSKLLPNRPVDREGGDRWGRESFSGDRPKRGSSRVHPELVGGRGRLR